MKEVNLLFLNSCVRGEDSRTQRLSEFFIHELKKKLEKENAKVNIKEFKLWEMDIPMQTYEFLKKRDVLIKESAFNDDIFNYAREVIEADYVVVGAPYWDWQFPAVLKMFLERASVPGFTYDFKEDGTVEGKCKANEAFYITTAGGYIGNLNLGYDYVNELFKIFGIGKTEFIGVEALDIPETKIEKTLEDAEARLRDVVKNLLAQNSY